MGSINRIFLIYFSLFIYNLASEESRSSKLSSDGLFLNDPKMETERNRGIINSDSYELPKKVSNLKARGEERRLENVVPPAADKICPVNNVRKGQIIRTNVSIKAGAKFLQSPSVRSVKQCHEMCCSSNECNTAIVKVENGHVLCYLFDCGTISVCSFDFHKDYKVIELKSQNIPANTSTAAPSFPVVLNASRNAAQEFSGGLNEVHCLVGHHRVASACRADCSNEFYFECDNLDRPSFSQCIATYDKCDGYRQCDDNSDEMGCPSKQGQDRPRSTTPASTLHFFSNLTTTAFGLSTTKIMLSLILNSSTTPLRHHKVYYKPQTTTSNDYAQLTKLSPREKIDEIRSGAMVALSLGIGLTLVSLVLLACRLQQFRKQGKSRKTKNMNGDSDYLINGLYL